MMEGINEEERRIFGRVIRKLWEMSADERKSCPSWRLMQAVLWLIKRNVAPERESTSAMNILEIKLYKALFEELMIDMAFEMERMAERLRRQAKMIHGFDYDSFFENEPCFRPQAIRSLPNLPISRTVEPRLLPTPKSISSRHWRRIIGAEARSARPLR